MRRIARTLALTCALAAACTPAAEDGEAAGKDPKQALRITATRIEAATIAPSTAAIQLVRPGEVDAAKEAHVAAALGGFVESVDVDVGDLVKKGQVLAKVDTSLQSANRALAKVEVEEAKREYNRIKGLGKAITKARIDAAKTRIERAKAQYRIAQIQSSRTVIKAPFAGVIADVTMEAGEVAPPGAMIARIVRLDPAVINVAVSDRDVGNLAVGGVASITTGANPSPIEGKIARIDPTANLKTRAFTVEVEVPNEERRFRPGMIATVEFRDSIAEDQIILPQELLVTKLDQNGVFVVDDDNVARWRPLVLGTVVRDQVIVAEGLRAGDNVVVLGHRSLADGDPLIVARQGECCTDGRVIFPDGSDTTVAAVAKEAPAP
jgi:membrane fusion protein (multidrug efflux system)